MFWSASRLLKEPDSLSNSSLIFWPKVGLKLRSSKTIPDSRTKTFKPASATRAKSFALKRVAQTQNRLLLTFDKDFGELAFRAGLPAKCGIILLRFNPSSPEHITTVTISSED